MEILHTLGGPITKPIRTIYTKSISKGRIPCNQRKSDAIQMPKYSPSKSMKSGLRPKIITNITIEQIFGVFCWKLDN